MIRNEIVFNKPMYVCLYLSKIIMFEFNYDCENRKWSKNIKLLYEDTDHLYIK